MCKFDIEYMQFLNEKRQEMKEKYNRVLPSGELLFNRFEKAAYLGFGANSSIYDTSIVMGDIKVGNNVWIGPYTILEGLNDELIIGDFVSIDAGVSIYTHDSTRYYLSGGKETFDHGKVEIKNNSVIGTMSMIKHGVTIGHHCVIGAHSFVTKDVPDYCIAAGTPAKIIGKVISDDEGIRYEYSRKSNDK